MLRPNRFLQTVDDRDEAYHLQREYAEQLVLLGLTPKFRVKVEKIKTSTGQCYRLVIREG